MRWTEKVIVAHKESLSNQPDDRRPKLIALWEQYRTEGATEEPLEMALEFAAKGNANEVELGFYVLMNLAADDCSLHCHINKLAQHRSATVRRNLAFFLSPELPPEFSRSVFAELLRDTAASVRIRAITTIGLRALKEMLPDLQTLRSNEQDDQVIEALEYWMPLLIAGYRLDRRQEPNRFLVTVVTESGIASSIVVASGPDDPRIREAVVQLRRSP